MWCVYVYGCDHRGDVKSIRWPDWGRCGVKLDESMVAFNRRCGVKLDESMVAFNIVFNLS
jgi:hypothetical protein